MAQKHKYKVNRHMLGDIAYAPGDSRHLPPAEAAALVATGALTDLGPAPAAEDTETKIDPALNNKVDPPLKTPAAKPAPKARATKVR